MKKLLLLFFTTLLSITLLSCAPFENPNPDYCVDGATDDVYLCSKTYTSYFDTTISLKFYLTKADTYDVDEMFLYTETILEEYHYLLDKYHQYDGITNVYTINANNDQTTVIPEKLYQVIEFGLANENLIQIDGVSLFNIALDPVLNIWHDARENTECDSSVSLAYDVCPVPNSLIDEVTFPTNPEMISLNSEDSSITFLEPGMSIDLGGYGKGYVSEILSDYFDSQNVKYLLNVGSSNIKAGGINPNNGDGYYYVALTKPDIEFSFTANYFVYLKIPDKISVVTSGNYQRFFIGLKDNEIYHHIIDPRTNYPGGSSMSVTVFYEDGAYADIFSTAIFLMTVEEGMAYVESTPGLEAIWYVSEDVIEYSSGFTNYLFEFL